MSKTIGQMAGRIIFTEKEIAMAQATAESAYDLNLQFASRDNIKLSKEQKSSMRVGMFKLVTKVIWDYKEKFYPSEEITEDKFKELAEFLLTSLFTIGKTGGNKNE